VPSAVVRIGAYYRRSAGPTPHPPAARRAPRLRRAATMT